MPLVSDPGYVLVRACVAAGLPVEVLPGPVGGDRRAGGLGAAGRPLALRGLPARARRASCERLLAEPGGTLVAFESPRRVPATLALLAELDPEREVAVCRELTKVHEEVVRGSAGELAERYAGAPPKGEVVLVLGPSGASRRRARARPPGSSSCAGWWRRARSRARRRGVVAELTGGERQRALPGAHRVTIRRRVVTAARTAA